VKILYFGNRSGQRGKYPTVQDELTPLFEKDYKIISVSDKRKVFTKALDMLITFFKHVWSADIVIIDTFSTNNFYFAMVIANLSRVFNKPYINFLHGGDLPNRLENSPFLSKITFKYAYKLVAPSNFMKTSFEKYGYNPILIPNMLRIENYPFKKKEFQAIRLFWLRSFRSHYNPILAVKILAQLRKEGIEADIIMVGPDSEDGSLKEVMAYVQSNNLEPYVKIPGLMSKAEWIKLSADRNILINTTNIDNTPISVIECMGLGLAIVSTEVGGIPFLLDNNKDALLVQPNDVIAMANAVKSLVQTPEISNKMVLNARKKVEGFDWEVVKHEWKSIIENAS
jgi:glycosyltransferase involved in cell wall biosynthesis